MAKTLPAKGYWPCFFSSSDTSGEKEVEEFYTADEVVELDSYKSIGIIKNEKPFYGTALKDFEKKIELMKNAKQWTTEDIADALSL